MAAIALADGPLRKDRAPDLPKVPLVNPGLGYGHDLIAIIEHEAIPVGVAEKVKGEDRTSGPGIDCGDRLRSASYPDELAVAFVGLLLNPGGIGFPIGDCTSHVSGPVNDPDKLGLFPMCNSYLGHPER